MPDEPLRRLTHAWPSPAPCRALDPDADQDTLDELREVIADPAGRASLAEDILETLIAERARPPEAAIETLRTWVRGFGTVQAPISA